jgi:hypothetical protein
MMHPGACLFVIRGSLYVEIVICPDFYPFDPFTRLYNKMKTLHVR